MPINLANVIVELEGVDADGAPPTANPVLVAGQDGANVQTLKTNATGQLEVDVVSGGGATTIADGADVNAGATTDAAETTDSDGTLSGKLRGLVKWAFERMPASLGQKAMAASFPVVVASDQSTLPISAASLPLPTGAATAANQQTDALTDAQLRATAVPVDGSGVTQPVSAAALPALAAGTNNIGAIRTYGVSGRMIDSDDGTTVITVKTVNGVATASGDNVVLAAVTGKKIRVLSYGLQVQEAGTVTARFQDNATATQRTMPWFLVAGATQYDGVVRNPGGDGHFYFETDAGVGLDLNLSGATDVGYELSYVEVD